MPKARRAVVFVGLLIRGAATVETPTFVPTLSPSRYNPSLLPSQTKNTRSLMVEFPFHPHFQVTIAHAVGTIADVPI